MDHISCYIAGNVFFPAACGLVGYFHQGHAAHDNLNQPFSYQKSLSGQHCKICDVRGLQCCDKSVSSVQHKLLIVGTFLVEQCSHQDFAFGSPRAPSSEK